MQEYDDKITAAAIAIEVLLLYILVVVVGVLFLAGCSPSSKPSPPIIRTLSWTDNSEGTAETQIERREITGDFAPLASVPPGVTEYVDAVLAGERYCYRVRAALDGLSSGYSEEACR